MNGINMASAHCEAGVTGHQRVPAVTPACDPQVRQLDIVLEDIGREDRDLVVREVTARVAGWEAGTRSHVEDGTNGITMASA